MRDVIGFLESMGARPAPAPEAYAAEVARLPVGEAVREALLRRDGAAVNALLGGRAAMWCAIMSPDDLPEEDIPGRDEPAREEPGPDDPQRDPDAD